MKKKDYREMGSGEANADTELRKNRKQKERANTGL